jgi:hypothetical protein
MASTSTTLPRPIVGTSDITDGSIVNADVGAAAAIAGSKIAPDFGAQNIVTTGFVSVGATPATAGNLRFPNNTTIAAFRNAANNADVVALFSTNADSVRLGPSTSNCFRVEADFASVISGGSTSMQFSSSNATARTPLRLAVSANNAGDPTIQDCTGTPEGQITAPVGSLALRRDGGASTTLYVKTSGSGNTGWTAK